MTQRDVHPDASIDSAVFIHPVLSASLRRVGLDATVGPSVREWRAFLADASKALTERASDRRRGDATEVTMIDLAAAAGVPIERFLDEATGIPNHEGLLEATRVAVRGASDDSEVAVLLVGLDGLGRVSDRLGARQGHEVIVAAAERIRSVLRSADLVARYDADQFGVLLGGPAESDPVRSVSSRIERAFAEPLVAAGHYVYFTASVGAALARSGSSAVDALRRGRQALEWKRSTNSHPARGVAHTGAHLGRSVALLSA